MTRFLILTIVKTGVNSDRYAFQMQNDNRDIYSNCNCLHFTLDIQTIEIESIASYCRWGRITNVNIHDWIVTHNLHYNPPRSPTKLIFEFTNIQGIQHLKLYSFQANLL
jgi:hypothetical protein